MTKSPEQIYDELLVLRSQDGDRRSFGELVSRWNGRLWRHARQLTDDRDAAADVLQEAWMAILRGFRRLKDPASFPKWAYRIVGNKSVDWIRRRQRARQVTNETPDILDGRDPSVPFEENDVSRLRDAMRQLSPDRRAILSLYYVDGMSVADIGEALAIPDGTVKSRLYHARAQLKFVLEGIKT